MPFPELLSALSCVALQAEALTRSSDSNAHYCGDWCNASAFALPETNRRLALAI
jgi:hypothetical protein